MRKATSLHQNQAGLVSIVITVIMITVLSLIVLAFSRLTQREERQALDRQLNANAFYAAETGVNDAVDALKKADPGDPILTTDDNDCDPPSLTSPPTTYTNEIEGASTQYSCLLMDPTPTSLEYGNISKAQTKAFPIKPKNGSNVNTLSVYWVEPDSPSPGFAGCPGVNSFPSAWPGNCSAGVIRLDIVRVDNSFDRNELIDQTATIFAMPVSAGGTGGISWSSARGFGNQGRIVGVQCVNNASLTSAYPKNCRLRITGMSSNRYYVRFTTIYKSATVTICAPDCNNSAQELAEAQALVDSTGKAADILRRIQVRVGISNLDGPYPSYAIESGDTLCKRFSISPPDKIFADGIDPACAIF